MKYIRLDASSLLQSDCKRSFYYINILGLTPKTPEVALEWGSAMHKAVAAKYRGATLDEATNLALEHYESCIEKGMQVSDTDYRNDLSLIEAIGLYYKEYKYDSFIPLQGEKDIAVELPFEIPFIVDEKNDITILLCGVMDAVGKTERNVIKDIKTTKMWNIGQYFESYEMSLQMQFYLWMSTILNIFDHPPCIIIDGVFIQKSGIKLARSQPIEYKSHIVDSMTRWLYKRAISIHQTYIEYQDQPEGWDYNLCRCNTLYGPCRYKQICVLQPAYQDTKIKTTYQKVIYDPSTFS